MKRKNLVKVAMCTVLATGLLVGCGKSSDTISVVSREEGSGTRSAFVELLEVTVDENDAITSLAEIASSTSVVMTSVETNSQAIGYISMGTLNDSVKAVSIDGTEATVENVKNGSYKISRPFNLVTKDGLSDVAQDFVDYILSTDGQEIANEEGYIGLETEKTYTADNASGKISIAGSTSVAPLMEALAEKYMELNKNVTIEIQQSGSSAGITSTIEGACDIGMASRELSDGEKGQGVSSTVIALDGICVIVNNENTIDSISSEQIKEIFLGNITSWSDIE